VELIGGWIERAKERYKRERGGSGYSRSFLKTQDSNRDLREGDARVIMELTRTRILEFLPHVELIWV
jgi:hypothetical protein